MSQTRPLRLGNGFLYVEMEEAEVPPLPATENREEPSGAEFEDTPGDAELINFQDDFNEAVGNLRSTIDALATDVARALENAAPTEWSLEFNIGFKGKASPIPVLLSGEGSAALKLTATWKRQ